MAEPQERARTAASTVASCEVTDCKYNDHRECHAGQIDVRVGGQGAICATYDPEKPRARP
jgi:hypothetical protein